MGVGRPVRVKDCSGLIAVTRVFRVRVARSLSRVRKLWTGRPFSVRPVVCLVTAAGERSALGDDAGALRFGRILVRVIVEQRRQALAHMPLQVIGEHAKKHVGPHAIDQPVIGRPDLEIDGLDAAEGALHQAEGFVAAHRGGGGAEIYPGDQHDRLDRR
jgi:hypothetical protein